MAKITTNELRKRLSAFAHQWAGASSEKADEKLFTAYMSFNEEMHNFAVSVNAADDHFAISIA